MNNSVDRKVEKPMLKIIMKLKGGDEMNISNWPKNDKKNFCRALNFLWILIEIMVEKIEKEKIPLVTTHIELMDKYFETFDSQGPLINSKDVQENFRLLQRVLKDNHFQEEIIDKIVGQLMVFAYNLRFVSHSELHDLLYELFFMALKNPQNFYCFFEQRDLLKKKEYQEKPTGKKISYRAFDETLPFEQIHHQVEEFKQKSTKVWKGR